jgi:hypothetical protein
MRIQLVLSFLAFLAISNSAGAEERSAPAGKAARPASEANKGQIKLICKTGSDKRAPGQPLKLFFQYNLPFQFEPEDPTVPFGRQTFVLAGRPVVQLYFEKSPNGAGERGENLAPMQCAFANRALGPKDPNQVQILIPAGEVAWLSQTLGQKPGGGQERALVAPASDWSFAYQYDKVFTLELENTKDFVTTQKPKAL